LSRPLPIYLPPMPERVCASARNRQPQSPRMHPPTDHVLGESRTGECDFVDAIPPAGQGEQRPHHLMLAPAAARFIERIVELTLHALDYVQTRQPVPRPSPDLLADPHNVQLAMVLPVECSRPAGGCCTHAEFLLHVYCETQLPADSICAPSPHELRGLHARLRRHRTM